MNKLNNTILIGMAGSKARFENSQYVCHDCLEKHTKSWNEFNIGTADYCECCERSILECSANGYLYKDVKPF